MTEKFKGLLQKYRIVHLSDLHFTGRPLGELSGRFWQLFKMDEINPVNLRILFDDLVSVNPHHIIISGDITNTAHPVEFRTAKEWFLQLQQRLRPTHPYGHDLDPDLFTIIPGNHDIGLKSGWIGRKKALNSRLQLFMTHFGATLLANANDIYDYESIFPIHKSLFGCIDLFALNSNVDIPVHVVGFNASGSIGQPQLGRLKVKMDYARIHEGRYRIVICHHHPLTIPYNQDTDLEEDFLVMKDARKLLRMCFENGVHLILHGHKHTPFIWKNELIPELDPPHSMAVVSTGSPTFARTGSSHVYNRYVAFRVKEDGKDPEIHCVEMHSRRYDPRGQAKQFRETTTNLLFGNAPNDLNNVEDFPITRLGLKVPIQQEATRIQAEANIDSHHGAQSTGNKYQSSEEAVPEVVNAGSGGFSGRK
jgi:3',5'-cyclic AMP phosphodiesterase CpdA